MATAVLLPEGEVCELTGVGLNIHLMKTLINRFPNQHTQDIKVIMVITHLMKIQRNHLRVQHTQDFKLIMVIMDTKMMMNRQQVAIKALHSLEIMVSEIT